MWIFKLFAWFKNWYYPVKLIPYENLYPLGTKKENIQETIENILHKRVNENTPNGDVMMNYDESSNTFFYWSDKTIEYKHLEVVARKFVILYDCKEIYVNIFRELLKAMNKKPEEQVQGPYVIFKSYNTISHKLSSNKVVNEKSNQYKRLGKWGEVTVHTSEFKPLSFLEYKKYGERGLPNA
jgi:hypothetical protein